MSLYRFIHLGSERPFELTDEDLARRRSWLKTIGTVVGIIAGIAATSTWVTANIKSMLEARDVVPHAELLVQAKEYADQNKVQAAGYADDIKAQLNQRMDSTDKKVDMVGRDVGQMRGTVDEILLHSRYVHGVVSGNAPTDYEKLPRRPTK